MEVGQVVDPPPSSPSPGATYIIIVIVARGCIPGNGGFGLYSVFNPPQRGSTWGSGGGADCVTFRKLRGRRTQVQTQTERQEAKIKTTYLFLNKGVAGNTLN